MYKYQLLHKPTFSTWPSSVLFVPKKTLIFILILLVLSLVGIRWMKNSELNKFYKNHALRLRNLKYPNQPSDERLDAWRLTDIYQTHIFSAYFDDRPDVLLKEIPEALHNRVPWAMIRIIGIIRLDLEDLPLTCYYEYVKSSDGKKHFILKRANARIKPIARDENFHMRYIAAFILCEFPTGDDTRGLTPVGVTVSKNYTRGYSDFGREDFVAIRYPADGFNSGKRKEEKFMAVCVPSFHHKFKNSPQLIEFVEFYRMMGADRFTFYNGSITPEVGRVLDYYSELNVTKVLQWRLPPYYIFEKTIRVDGLFASINDCLYRSSSYMRYKYVAQVDVDEFIVPKRHANYMEMMKYLDPPKGEESNRAASYVFRNAFFYLMHEDDPVTQSADIPILYLHAKTMRWPHTNIMHDRSKYIIRGQDVVEIGNHRVWDFRKGNSSFYRRAFEEVEVDPDVASSHHYRYCETEVETCWLRSTRRDTSAHRFTKELGKRVAKVCKEIFENGCPKNPHSKLAPKLSIY
ncbi:uncharacterized protein LOC107271581 [Cephus cinctus]|uniref:Glycosyltransferase family 92 protein n=1 Tax=Cephus cinctus TaxID=211228 RepID=A0AAJ7C6S7_CEPCN|nr:uncharacterized protein LOC107271581 [Cephus cinctus]